MGDASSLDDIPEIQWRKIQLLRLAFDIVDKDEEYVTLENLEERLAYLKSVAEKLLRLK